MIRVTVKKQSNYPVSAIKIKRELTTFLKKRGIVSDAEISIALVGEKKMIALSKKYLKDNKLHNVLSFPASEVKDRFIFPPDGIIRLGEIVVCYKKAFEEAQQEGELIEEKVIELVKHGAEHLMGIHHD